jgi:hypothetical protein
VRSPLIKIFFCYFKTLFVFRKISTDGFITLTASGNRFLRKKCRDVDGLMGLV